MLCVCGLFLTRKLRYQAAIYVDFDLIERSYHREILLSAIKVRRLMTHFYVINHLSEQVVFFESRRTPRLCTFIVLAVATATICIHHHILLLYMDMFNFTHRCARVVLVKRLCWFVGI